MKQKIGKKLVLKRETVRELTESQLGWVAGGQTSPGSPCPFTQWPTCNKNQNSFSGNSCVCATCGPSCQPGCCGG
jgi:hypothetical protein